MRRSRERARERRVSQMSLKKEKPQFQESHRYNQMANWIEKNFQKRVCVKFHPSLDDKERCHCGLAQPFHAKTDLSRSHSLTSQPSSASEGWSPQRNTVPQPTDAFGTLEFKGCPQPMKAQYVRLAYDTKPETLLYLLTRQWQLELPKLLITVHGGKANFDLQPKLKRVFRKGLVQAAKTTGAWIFTSGINSGVTHHVGKSLLNERTPRLRNRVVSIGIAPWGIVENNKSLIGRNAVVRYHNIANPKSKFAVLNSHHAYFILVDNGSAGQYGAEIGLRKALEKHIATKKIYTRSDQETCGVPVVCVVVEGGLNTIRTVLEYVTDSPPVPVVVCDGSGRAADLLAFAHKYMQEDITPIVREQLQMTIEKTFNLDTDEAGQVFEELMKCVRKRDLITVFRMGEGPCQELDQAILTALLRGLKLPPEDQLALAMTWNRVDIARREIFVYGQEWAKGALEKALMDALVMDRVEFVRVILENGVSMENFLTIPRLEELYNTMYGPNNILSHLVKGTRKHMSRDYRYTLHEIGQVINKLMGGAYSSSYSRRKFRTLYNSVMRRNSICSQSESRVWRNQQSPLMSNIIQHMAMASIETLAAAETSPFSHPFNELLIWAVLTKRHRMALFMWENGEEALVKALVACKLYKSMVYEASQDDMEAEISEEMGRYSEEFEQLGLELLDYCYRQDDDVTLQLLTYELDNWSKQTALSLAFSARHNTFLAHPASQVLLADLWMGGLRAGKNANLKVIVALLFPPAVLFLEFKSKEELEMMPHREEQHVAENKKDSLTNNGQFETVKFVSAESEDYIYDPPKHKWYSFPFKNWRAQNLRKRFHKFFTAPIAKFWGHTMAYGVFLFLFTYVVLVRMAAYPSWQEAYVIAYLCTLGMEKIREIVSSEPERLLQKLAVWAEKKWNPCDLVVIVLFQLGLVLRMRTTSLLDGRVLYVLNIVYWYVRILDLLSVNKYLGPYVTMIGKMVANMMYFVVLLLVVLMSYGVARQAILFPFEEPHWRLARNIFYMPYWMLYGEVFQDKIEPACSKDACPPASWINPAIMAVYLLISNILIVNLLIAVFNNIFTEVNSVSQVVWKSQRYRVVMEYEQKPILPPPLIIFSHLYLLLTCLLRCWRRETQTFDNGLKLFLDEKELDNLNDFEEECMEGYFQERENKLQESTAARVQTMAERVDLMAQRIEDINLRQKELACSFNTLQFQSTKMAGMTKTSHDLLHEMMELAKIGQQHCIDSRLLPPSPERQPSEGKTSPEPNSDHSDCGPKPSSSVATPKVMFTEPAAAEEDELIFQFHDVSKLPRRTSLRPEKLSRQITIAAPETLGKAFAEDQDIVPGSELRRRRLSRAPLLRGLSMSHVDEELDEHDMILPLYSGLEKAILLGSQWNRNDPTICVIPPSPKPPLSSTKGEYTSITDELESVANLLKAATQAKSKPQGHQEHKEALEAETELLHGAEKLDYELMGGLIKKRFTTDKSDKGNHENVIATGSESVSSAILSNDTIEDIAVPPTPTRKNASFHRPPKLKTRFLSETRL